MLPPANMQNRFLKLAKLWWTAVYLPVTNATYYCYGLSALGGQGYKDIQVY